MRTKPTHQPRRLPIEATGRGHFIVCDNGADMGRADRVVATVKVPRGYVPKPGDVVVGDSDCKFVIKPEGVDAPKRPIAQHTPGPWHREKARTSNLHEIRGADGLYVAYTGGYGIDPVVEDANAAVLAAAPDMLAALHAVGRFLAAQGVDPRTPAFVAVNAAIAKATGAKS